MYYTRQKAEGKIYLKISRKLDKSYSPSSGVTSVRIKRERAELLWKTVNPSDIFNVVSYPSLNIHSLRDMERPRIAVNYATYVPRSWRIRGDRMPRARPSFIRDYRKRATRFIMYISISGTCAPAQ